MNFILNDREHLAIYGANGAGKSMLVDIITGRHPLLHNQAKYDFSPSKLPYIADNIKLITFRDSYGAIDNQYYLQQRWNQHELTEENAIVTLSSGELRKHMLRQALEQRPRVLIIDNPYIGLDVTARQELTDTLKQLISNFPLQIILVVSRKADIPDFITRTVVVENMHIVEPLIQFNHVNIRYGTRTILQDFSWTVQKGEHWAIKGPNGSGKSTLLSLICADNPQGYAADITLFGKKRGGGESIWDIKKHIGYVSPELHRAYKHNLPAIEIVASGLKDTVGLYAKPSKEEKEVCLQWLEVFGIAPLADKAFLQLSSGEQRMVLLARAFVKSPLLLILDEPLHGLDDANSIKVKRIINDYCKDPEKTLLMVTHYDNELPECIDNTLVLSKI
ncbi:MAG: ATP-binding cassette domain-containing protein [Prevotella sp.]